MSDVIAVRQFLEVKPGGVLAVPGCEPISSLTSLALARNIKCNASIIPVKDALALIPGSKLVWREGPRGTTGTNLLFQFPEGSPSPDGNVCPELCYPDWYQILRDNAHAPEQDVGRDYNNPCSAVNFNSCVVEPVMFQHPADPSKRPNSNPL